MKKLILSSTESSNHPVSPDELVNWNVLQYGLYQKEGSMLMTQNNNDSDIIVHIEIPKNGF